ncbi:hypothetical protein ACFQPF_05410 [Fictibacillus iocasae]|uniref:Uncharacterized protein n=1 Tax=Fictibacillus iocasae TaxID=2715437 RepID=A0ABW2NPC9_9BACL
MGFMKNVLSFGASGRIESKIEELEDLQYDYQRLHERMEFKRAEVNDALERVIEVKVQGVASLKKISSISVNLKAKDREMMRQQVSFSQGEVNFSAIETTISAGELAINASKGMSAGVGTALGAWALVSTYGAASTGTAIAGLTGAAATNATLAWFGGGALAAGGGGMAAGTAMLGGVIALPALALAGVFSHIQANKKIGEIEKQMTKIVKAMDQVKGNLLKLELIEERSGELAVSLEKAISAYDQEFAKTYLEIYPVAYYSKTVKWIRKNIFRKNYFSEQDLKAIAYIGGLAGSLATLIDTKVFEE